MKNAAHKSIIVFTRKLTHKGLWRKIFLSVNTKRYPITRLIKNINTDLIIKE